MKRLFLIACLILLIQLSSYSQSKYVYYFDNDINVVSNPKKAVFEGVGIFQNGLLELKVIDKKSRQLLVIEHFTDSSLQTANGLLVTFQKNGKQSEGNYLLGKQDGLWKKWNWDGQIIDSSIFDKGEKIMQTTFSYYPDGKIFILNIDSIKEGKKKIVYFDVTGNIMTPSKSPDDPDKVFTSTEIEPAFPGGPNAWSRYITTVIEKHIEQLNRKQEFGTCILRFIVRKDGSVSEIEATTMKGTRFAEIAIEAVKKGPKWFPAQQNREIRKCL